MAKAPFHVCLLCEQGVTASLAHVLQWKSTSIRPAATWVFHCLPRSESDQARSFLVHGTGQHSPLWEQVPKNLLVKINAAFSPKAGEGKKAWRQRETLTWGFFSSCKHHQQVRTATRTQAMHKTPGERYQASTDFIILRTFPKLNDSDSLQKGSISK